MIAHTTAFITLVVWRTSTVGSWLNISSIFIYTRKEGNILFNDALNTFYLRLYGEHMINDHSDYGRGNPLTPLHGLPFSISRKGYFICSTNTDIIVHTMDVVTPVVQHWLEREIAQWVIYRMHDIHMITSCYLCGNIT